MKEREARGLGPRVGVADGHKDREPADREPLPCRRL